MDGHGRQSRIVAWFASAFTENVGLKVTSLLIALALFGLVRGAGNVQRSLEVSLLARLPPASARRVLVTDLPDKIRVTVRGSPSLVGGLRPDELGPVQIDLSDGRRPSYYFDSSLFQLPAGVQLTQIQPASLQLAWENLIERNVPVRAEITGTPGPGLRIVGPVEVTPPTARISGPELYVASLTGVHTDPLDVTGLPAGRHDVRVALDTPRPHVRYESNSGVRVAFTIDREIVERAFERVQVTPVGTAHVELRPPFVRVTVRGAPAAVNGLDPAELVPVVEVNEPARGSAHAPPAQRVTVTPPRLPDGVSLVAIEPTEVIVVPVREPAAAPDVYPRSPRWRPTPRPPEP